MAVGSNGKECCKCLCWSRYTRNESILKNIDGEERTHYGDCRARNQPVRKHESDRCIHDFVPTAQLLNEDKKQ